MAETTRPHCLRCEAPIYQDDAGVWRREATGVADCPRNPARDGHEPVTKIDTALAALNRMFDQVVNTAGSDAGRTLANEDYRTIRDALSSPAERAADAWDQCAVAATGGGLTPLAQMLRDDNPYRQGRGVSDA